MIEFARDVWQRLFGFQTVQSGSFTGETIDLKGWIKRHRSSGKIIFMTIRDSTGEIQCVAKKADMKEEQFESLKNALIESSVELTGLVKSDDRAPGGHELIINSGNNRCC